MPKQSPVPNELTQPFWDAANEGRLVIQRCNACTDRRGLNVLQFPPEPVCAWCGSDKDLVWHQVSGRGYVQTYGVLHDAAQKSLQADQPLNMAVIGLEDAGPPGCGPGGLGANTAGTGHVLQRPGRGPLRHRPGAPRRRGLPRGDLSWI